MSIFERPAREKPRRLATSACDPRRETASGGASREGAEVFEFNQLVQARVRALTKAD